MTEEQRRKIQMEKIRQRRRQQFRQSLLLCVCTMAAFFVVVAVFLVVSKRAGRQQVAQPVPVTSKKYNGTQPDMEVRLLPVNPYSRPGTKLESVTGIVIHYTANPGTTAKQNRDYFAGLAESHTTSASSHFIIGLKGEIIQCIPCDEIAYATKQRNKDTISIECCIEDDSGRFNAKTYDSLVRLVTWLMGRYELGTADVLRHYDVTGKNCPKYYVENESSWRVFKSDLEDYIEQYGEERP